MRRIAAVIGVVVPAFFSVLLEFFRHFVAHEDGIPMHDDSRTLLVALGMLASGAISLFHELTCHEAGCWRYGRHLVAEAKWCTVHRERAARHDVSELLDSVRELVERHKKETESA